MAGWDRRDWAEQKTTWLYHRSSSSTTLSGSKAEPGAAPTTRYGSTEEPLLKGYSSGRTPPFHGAFTLLDTETDTDVTLSIYQVTTVTHLSFCCHIFQQSICTFTFVLTSQMRLPVWPLVIYGNLTTKFRVALKGRFHCTTLRIPVPFLRPRWRRFRRGRWSSSRGRIRATARSARTSTPSSGTLVCRNRSFATRWSSGRSSCQPEPSGSWQSTTPMKNTLQALFTHNGICSDISLTQNSPRYYFVLENKISVQMGRSPI